MTTPYVLQPWAWERLNGRREWENGTDTGRDLGASHRRAFVHGMVRPDGQWDDAQLTAAFAAYGWTLHVGGHGATATPLGEPWGVNGDAPSCPCGAPLTAPEGTTLEVWESAGVARTFTHPSGVGVCGGCIRATHLAGRSGRTPGCGWTDDTRTEWRCGM